jgi:hypothetical protein
MLSYPVSRSILERVALHLTQLLHSHGAMPFEVYQELKAKYNINPEYVLSKCMSCIRDIKGRKIG